MYKNTNGMKNNNLLIMNKGCVCVNHMCWKTLAGLTSFLKITVISGTKTTDRME